jgi:hypothetical protein
MAGFKLGVNEIYTVNNATVGMLGPAARPVNAVAQLCNVWTIKVKDGVSYVQRNSFPMYVKGNGFSYTKSRFIINWGGGM